MQKNSLLFLIVLPALGLLACYQALFPVPAQTAVIRFLGLASFFLLCVSLLIGPAAVLWPQRFVALVEPRRAIGMLAAVFALLHFSLIAILVFGWNISLVFSFIPLLVGMAALLLLLALAAISNDFSLHKLGLPTWKAIQRFAYLAFILSFKSAIELTGVGSTLRRTAK